MDIQISRLWSFPRPLSLSPLLPDVNIMITSGSDSRIESTLNANVSSLRETLIECSSSVSNSPIASNTTVQERQGICYIKIEYCCNVIFLFVAPLSTSSANCSLLVPPGGPVVSLQWSPSITSQHAVERYRVVVTPDPSSCSSQHQWGLHLLWTGPGDRLLLHSQCHQLWEPGRPSLYNHKV